MLDLFAGTAPWQEQIADGVMVLRRYAVQQAAILLQQIEQIAQQRPFRHHYTPSGYRMSVAMTGCGRYGQKSGEDLVSHLAEQSSCSASLALPSVFSELATSWAKQAGFDNFIADSCLINRYQPGARLTLHQDKEERDLRQPIVSVSLGLPAKFQFGGYRRSDISRKILLEHGDIIVWGGVARLCFHGILPVRPGNHPLIGEFRYNLTLRRAY